MGGKRDLISNRTNYLWFTPDSAASDAWNGACVEYCGASHANMRFRAFTVSAEDFESWAAHQKSPATMLAPPPAAPTQPGATPAAGQSQGSQVTPPAAGTPAGVSVEPAVVQTGFTAFPREKIPLHARANMPIPASIQVQEMAGDAARGEAGFIANGCHACHAIQGLRNANFGVVGPSLTHFATRSTLGAGIYPNDTRHLTAWIANAPLMKPGITMPVFGKGQIHPKSQQRGALEPQQIADIVAYLQTLK
jgi:cytochrome c oxidase subunit 2